MNSFLKKLSLLLLVALIATPLLSGCGDKKKNLDIPAEKQLVLDIPNVYQYTNIGKNKADGQFVVLNIVMANETTESMTIDPEDFFVRLYTDIEEDRYSLPIQKRMANEFGIEFGAEEKAKLLETTDFDLHPKIQAERFLIFQLPKSGHLIDYELYYEPLELATPIITSYTESFDRRVEEDYY